MTSVNKEQHHDTASGDARGLAELFIVRDLMAPVNKTRRQSDQLDPWQLFDLIAGSSTGGQDTLHGAQTIIIHPSKLFTLPCLCIIYCRMICLLTHLHLASLHSCLAGSIWALTNVLLPTWTFQRQRPNLKNGKRTLSWDPTFKLHLGKQFKTFSEKSALRILHWTVRCQILIHLARCRWPPLFSILEYHHFRRAHSWCDGKNRFVVSSQASTGRPVLLRSYDNPQSPSPTVDC